MDPRYSSSLPHELRYLAYWICTADHDDLVPDLSRPSRYAKSISEASTIHASDIDHYEAGVDLP